MADALESWPAFARAVSARLEAGRQTYGDRSFSAHPAELASELEQEALDLAGWGFVLWQRCRAMRMAAQRLADGMATGGAAPPPDLGEQ